MRKLVVAALLGGAIVVIGAVTAGVVIWQRVNEPYQGFAGPEQFVDVPRGAGPAAIGRRLVEAGIVRDDFTFRAAVWWSGQARALQAGEYRFDGPLPAVAVVERLARGDVYARRVTFPEGLNIQDMARIYELHEFGSAESFTGAASDPALIMDLDPGADDLEGYLFPDTYALPRATPAPRLVALMVARFRAAYTDELRGLAEEQGFTTRQVVTLASIIEKETGKPEERPLVAAVFRNRLNRGMWLQADPTVIYALQRAGQYDGNIRRQDLAFDSPYNTYRYGGLPPGPIAAPGQASLEAALAPAAVDYLYFVSRNDGSHVFAETLTEHNRNVREYQILFFRR